MQEKGHITCTCQASLACKILARFLHDLASSFLLGAPDSYIEKMLADWYQWRPGDDRGSTGFATKEDIAKAPVWVSQLGIYVTAKHPIRILFIISVSKITLCRL